MSVSAHYEKLICSSYKLIHDKQAENDVLAGQEAEQEKLLSQEKENLNDLKRKISGLQSKIYSFLRENGGLFNLNEEQKCFYLSLLDQKGSLSSNLFSSKNLKYSLSSSITGLENRQHSNYLTIFNATFDIGDYKNQSNLFSRLETT